MNDDKKFSEELPMLDVPSETNPTHRIEVTEGEGA